MGSLSPYFVGLGRGALFGVVVTALVSCGGRPKRSAAGEERSLAGGAAGWNVLLLSVDTLRADRLGAWGYERESSPRMDRLVAGGARFTDAAAPRALTWPSLASVLTGVYPSRHGLIVNGYRFAPRVYALPGLLQERGYQTAAVLGNMCRAYHQGWDLKRCTKSRDSRLLGMALDWLDRRDPERPFLLWAHYFGPHSPYTNGRSFIDRFSNADYAGPVGIKKALLDRIMVERIPLTAADRQRLDDLYDAAVFGTDLLVGQLLDALDERVLLERTLVVFLSDHGEDLYQHHGYVYHACSVYETSLRVPLAIVAPGLVAPQSRIEQTVELIDVLPTLLELLGIETERPLDGVSLVPLLAESAPRAGPRPAFSEYNDTEIHTVRAGRWKLVSNPQGEQPLCFEGAPPDLYPLKTVELYDLDTDPLEQTDVAAQHPEVVARLHRLLEQRFGGEAGRAGRQEIPEDLKKELEALGYLAD